jgi:hypothetical protein
VDLFDLTKTPERIGPLFLLDGFFPLVGLSLLILAIWILRKVNPDDKGFTPGNLVVAAVALVPVSLLWTGIAALLGYYDIRHAYDVRSAVIGRRYSTLEGCLDFFTPGVPDPGKNANGDEHWVVKGHGFSYGGGDLRFAYHKIEPQGGIVHPDSWVRVSFVPDRVHERDDIIRLETQRDACPRATERPLSR